MSRIRVTAKKRSLTRQAYRVYSNSITRHLSKGDVLAYRLRRDGAAIKKLVNNVICLFTDTEYFHVEVYVGGGWSITAAPKGVCYSDTINWQSNIAVLRLTAGLSGAQADLIERECVRKIGLPYGFFETLLLPVARKKAIARRSRNSWYNCTEFTARAYESAGITLVPESCGLATLSPKSIVCSPLLKFVGSWDKGRRTPEPLHGREKYLRRAWCIARLVSWVLRRLSKRDEYFRQIQTGATNAETLTPYR